MTTGFSGADLENLCNEAALLAAGRNADQVTLADFREALDRVRLGGVRPWRCLTRNAGSPLTTKGPHGGRVALARRRSCREGDYHT